jgi:hypothetical protein
VKWEAFRELFQASVEGSYNEAIKDWRGWLLLAIDSSHIALPPDAALREYYGAVGHELSAATARASILYDIENDIIVDATIEGLTVDERSLAKTHIEALGGRGLDFGGRKPVVMCHFLSPNLSSQVPSLAPEVYSLNIFYINFPKKSSKRRSISDFIVLWSRSIIVGLNSLSLSLIRAVAKG